MKWTAQWIRPLYDFGNVVPLFSKHFSVKEDIKCATLIATALGVYEASINGKRVSNYVLAPGWTAYEKRLQFQQYDITNLIDTYNTIEIIVGKGWYRSPISGYSEEKLKTLRGGLLAQIIIEHRDGNTEIIGTDEHWEIFDSNVRFSEIYNGEIYDATSGKTVFSPAESFEGPYSTLIPQEGEIITEHEVIEPKSIIKTPKGEMVIDFGQEITGYVEITIDAHKGETVKLSHGETLDRDGNFYNDNYRSAKAELTYICKEGTQTYHPKLTFYGFRYVRIDAFPAGPSSAKASNFKAIAVYSDIRRTGHITCSSEMLNRLVDNVIWGQKCNFLDIPTDCPQRDERLGWTGDAQVFVRAAAYNYDVEKFFSKWLNCLRAEQGKNGRVGLVIPDTFQDEESSAGWGDAATICPWEIYMAYGNQEILARQFESMRKRIDYITEHTTKKYLWLGSTHFGDWLGLDSTSGSYKGASRESLIASAYYAYSTYLYVKAGAILGENVAEYEMLYKNIVNAFRAEFPELLTQTECAIAVHFRLAENCQKVADQLNNMVISDGHLTTGFIGTPYILHALSDYGHTDTAYMLLLREDYPSWLYPITKGATTIWEHWDGIKPDGTFWNADMNSFNHYAYGAVIDWIYGVAAGIKPISAGYKKVRIEPHPSDRLSWLQAEVDSRAGKIRSEWKKQGPFWRYEISTPVKAEIIIDGKKRIVEAGDYCFFSE